MAKTQIRLNLIGEDGNAFAIMGRATDALKGGGMAHLKDDYLNEAMAGDYDHLLRVTMEWFDCDSDEEEEEEEEEECDEDWWED